MLFAFLCLATLTGLAAGWMLCVPKLRESAATSLSVDSVRIRFPEFPGWLQIAPDDSESGPTELARIKRAIIDDITDAARSQIQADPFNRTDLLGAKSALEATGWFLTVDRLERARPDLINVSATYVEPFTMVRDAEGNHLIAENGVLLPLRFAPTYKLERMPLISGARFPRPQRFGARWPGKDITAGIQLASLLEGRQWAPQIVEIDVSDYARNETLLMRTERGARILWGRAPGEERGREVPADQKLSYLDYFYKESGRVEGKHNYNEIDLALDIVYAR